MICEYPNNQNTYQKMDKNLDPTNIKKNKKKLLNRHKSIFTDNDIKDLNEADYNTKTF